MPRDPTDIGTFIMPVPGGLLPARRASSTQQHYELVFERSLAMSSCLFFDACTSVPRAISFIERHAGCMAAILHELVTRQRVPPPFPHRVRVARGMAGADTGGGGGCLVWPCIESAGARGWPQARLRIALVTLASQRALLPGDALASVACMLESLRSTCLYRRGRARPLPPLPRRRPPPRPRLRPRRCDQP